MREPADPSARLDALEDTEQLLEILEQIPAVLGVLRGPEHIIEFANPAYQQIAGGVPMLGRRCADVFDQPENGPFVELLDRIHRTGETFQGTGWQGLVDGRPVFYDFVYVPLLGAGDAVEGVLVHAVDVTSRIRAERAARESDDRFERLMDSNVVGVCVADEEWVVEANDACLAIMGHTREELEAGVVSWRGLTPSEWTADDDRALRDLRATGRAEAYEKEFVRADGTRVPVLLGAATIDRDPLRMVAFFLDQTDRRAAEREREVLLAREREARREAELAAGRIARLQRMTAALSAAISADEVSQLVVEHAMEALGAAAAVIVLREGDELVVGAHTGYEPELLDGWTRFPVDAPVPLAAAVESGTVILLEDAEEVSRRYPAITRSSGSFEAIASLPLVFHGEALGGMGLSFTRPRAFSAGDRGFLLALGRQCAQALERARLYEERAYVARTLQQGLLPDRLSEVPGLEVAVRYHSISDGGAVGGDFYDLFDVEEDRWLLAIGDVCGKGTAAAVLTGLARHTIRAIAMREPSPAEVLSFLNETMRRQLAESTYCTVGCASLTRGPNGSIVACMASGGHVSPLLLREGEPVREVEVPGTLLGFVPDLRLESVEVTLVRGDVLVFYTDGITDARDEGERFGDARLHATLEAARSGSAEEIADAVEQAVRRHQPNQPKDDRAVMVLRVTGE